MQRKLGYQLACTVEVLFGQRLHSAAHRCSGLGVLPRPEERQGVAMSVMVVSLSVAESMGHSSPTSFTRASSVLATAI